MTGVLCHRWKRVKSGILVLFITPAALALIILNCVSWTLQRLRTGGLPVRMGVGWPWTYYAYPVFRVEPPAEWSLGALFLNVAAGLCILLAIAGVILLFTRNKKQGWR